MAIRPIGKSGENVVASATRFVKEEVWIAEQIGQIKGVIKEKEAIKGNIIEVITSKALEKLVDGAQKLSESVVKGVQKIQKGLVDSNQGFKSKNAERKTIQDEIASLEAQKKQIIIDYKARKAATVLDNERIAKLNTRYKMEELYSLAEKHAIGEVYFQAQEELKAIEVQKKVLKAQLQAIETKIKGLDIQASDAADEAFLANQFFGLTMEKKK